MPAAKTKSAVSLYAVVGSDSGGVSSKARELAGQLSPGGDFDTETVDGVAK